MTRTTITAAVLSALVAGSAIVALADTGSTDRNAGQPGAAPASAESARPTFAPFRRAQVAADKIPGTPDPKTLSDLRPGENPSESRAILGSDGAVIAYIWPTTGGVCMATEDGSTCGSFKQIADLGALTMTTQRSNRASAQIVGVTPDGTTDLQVRAADKSAAVSSVQRVPNAFSATITAAPAAGAAGTGQKVGLSVPPKITLSWRTATGKYSATR